MEILPLVPSVPEYDLVTSLDGRMYRIDMRWNGRDGAWYMSLATESGHRLLDGCKVALGAIIGARSTDPLMPGVFVAVTDQPVDAGLDDVGFDAAGAPLRVQLYFVPWYELA